MHHVGILYDQIMMHGRRNIKLIVSCLVQTTNAIPGFEPTIQISHLFNATSHEALSTLKILCHVTLDLNTVRMFNFPKNSCENKKFLFRSGCYILAVPSTDVSLL